MNNSALLLKVKERLNKLDSYDNDNLNPWMIVEAFNKVQLQWARTTIGGNPQQPAGDELDKQAVDDLQVLISTLPIRFTDSLLDKGLVEAPLPADYLAFKRLNLKAKSSCCPAKSFKTYFCPQADVQVWLADENRRPDFEWAETFYSLQANKVQVFTSGLFTVDKTSTLTYYREPQPIRIVGVLDLATEELALTEQACELPNSVCELLLDLTVGVLAGDTENITQYQRASQDSQRNA